MINPSTLDLKTLPWLPLTEKSAFPKQAAIYFAIDSLGCVQYIGRSVNVRARWGSHHKYSALNNLGNVKVAYLFVDMPELLPQIETALIEYFQPPLNKIGFKTISKVPITVFNKRNYTQVRIIIPEDYRRLFKALCTELDTDMSKSITTYIEQELIKAGKLTKDD